MARSRASSTDTGQNPDLGNSEERLTNQTRPASSRRDAAGSRPNTGRSQQPGGATATSNRGSQRPGASTRSRSYEGSTPSKQGIEATDWEQKNSRNVHRSPPRNPPGADARWVDQAYRDANPWYSQADKKPIFSLGRPLPRTVRWNSQNKQADAGTQAARGAPSKSKEDLAELGEVDSDDAISPDLEKQATTQSRQPEAARHTTDGTSHGDKFNDVGQPVFNYMPGGSNTNVSAAMSRRGTNESHARQTKNKTDEEGEGEKPDYGIDSEPLGQREADAVEQTDRDPDEFRNWWARLRARHPEPLAEFLATGVAVFLGLAGTLSVNLSANQPSPYGTYETSCWAWGFAWMFGIYLGGGVSGAHMNPAISVSLSLFRGFPWKQCLYYVVAQFIASFVAGGLAYGCFADTIRSVDPTMSNTALSFFSTPPDWVSLGTAFLNQMVGSAIMMIAVFALGDDQNNPPGAGMHAFVLGLLVTTLKMTLGFNIGSALNPASDFGPRVIAYASGYHGSEVFSTNWWLYGPWLATLAGSVVGCSVYDGFIFTGSESPINYRVPQHYRNRAKKMLNLKTDQ
ncbi:Uu.00g031910.m01.CDS01 [Anthostomella pinea]|uniref:Uu.00g031910.m01.CDS01 n=1 Tax=Anthostomella pinea TaxID=933095 RepID=A0AAI8V8M2_9PEZI|nr:Uu.00g031910.m01.CDS01 [Anthostomella pinea]